MGLPMRSRVSAAGIRPNERAVAMAAPSRCPVAGLPELCALGAKPDGRTATFRPSDEPCSEYRSDPEATEFPREVLHVTAYSSRRSRRCGCVEAVRSFGTGPRSKPNLLPSPVEQREIPQCAGWREKIVCGYRGRALPPVS